MANQDHELLAFNRGVLSPLGLARIDIDRYAFSADTQKNWVPRVLGSMMVRPGMKYLATMKESLNLVRQMPFIFEEDDTALLEIGFGGYLRVRINDVLLVRPSVSTAITNGSFTGTNDAAPPSWSVDDDANCDSFILSNNLELRGSGEGFARSYQTLTVAVADQNVEHGLEIVVGKGKVLCRVGSTVQGEEYFRTILGPGTHHLALTPTGNFTIELSNDQEFNAIVESCEIFTGTVELATPWTTEANLRSLRWDQSGDRVYVACDGVHQKVVERRFAGRSWSLVDYIADDGPFKTQNIGSVTLTPSAIQGDYDPNTSTFITLTASEPMFTAEHAQSPGALFRLESAGQTVTNTSSADDGTATNPIRVVGSGDAREFGIIIEGTFSATVTLQFSFDESGPWNDQGQTWTTPVSTNFNDGQDGQIIYYRLIVKVGDWTSGSATMTLTYTGGSKQGVARVREYVSPTVVRIGILEAFGSIDATKDWWEGEWSYDESFPNALAIHEGRLFQAGADRIWGSVSDDFESHDDSVEGDSGPINRTIGSGAIRKINWILSMARMMMGTSENSANIAPQRLDGNNPLSARSSNFDEPLTPFNFNIKTTNSRGVFVDRTKQRLFELIYDIDIQDFKPVDLSLFAPDYNIVGLKQIAVQMKPDIRVHCVRNDGTVGMLVYDRAENVRAWCEIELGGSGTWLVEDVSILPGDVEDQVYYTVRAENSVDGEQRYLLKWSQESQAIGGLNNYMSDAWLQRDSTPVSALTGVSHLAGETVTVWADGAYVGDAVVSVNGEVNLSAFEGAPFSNIVVGLKYMAPWKSSKLGTMQGIGLLENKRINKIGFLALNMHYQGLQYGPSLDQLYDLPLVERGQITPADFIWDEYHEENFPFGGEWEEDSRICLQGESPKPCTLQAALVEYQSVAKLRR